MAGFTGAIPQVEVDGVVPLSFDCIDRVLAGVARIREVGLSLSLGEQASIGTTCGGTGNERTRREVHSRISAIHVPFVLAARAAQLAQRGQAFGARVRDTRRESLDGFGGGAAARRDGSSGAHRGGVIRLGVVALARRLLLVRRGVGRAGVEAPPDEGDPEHDQDGDQNPVTFVIGLLLRRLGGRGVLRRRGLIDHFDHLGIDDLFDLGGLEYGGLGGRAFGFVGLGSGLAPLHDLVCGARDQVVAEADIFEDESRGLVGGVSRRDGDDVVEDVLREPEGLLFGIFFARAFARRRLAVTGLIAAIATGAAACRPVLGDAGDLDRLAGGRWCRPRCCRRGCGGIADLSVGAFARLRLVLRLARLVLVLSAGAHVAEGHGFS